MSKAKRCDICYQFYDIGFPSFLVDSFRVNFLFTLPNATLNRAELGELSVNEVQFRSAFGEEAMKNKVPDICPTCKTALLKKLLSILILQNRLNEILAEEEKKHTPLTPI